MGRRLDEGSTRSHLKFRQVKLRPGPIGPCLPRHISDMSFTPRRLQSKAENNQITTTSITPTSIAIYDQ